MIFFFFKKKKISLVVFLFSLLLLFQSLLSKEITIKQFFQKVQEKNQKNYPHKFSCLLSSTIINFQIKNIPIDMIEFKQKPQLYFNFKMKTQPKLKLKGVLPFYQNYFLPYEGFIRKTGLFIGVDNYHNLKDLQKEFKIKLISQGKDSFKIYLKEKDGLSGDYAQYLFNKETTLTEARFYEKGMESIHLAFFYLKKKYAFPKRIIVKVSNIRKLDQIKNQNEYFIDFKNCQ